MRDTIHMPGNPPARSQNQRGLPLSELKGDTAFIGFGIIGYYIPNYFFRLPFRWRGTVLPDLLPLMSIAAVLGVAAVLLLDYIHIDAIMHQLLGFVLGFLLVFMGNLSNGKYEEAVNTMNQAVQDGASLCAELLSVIPNDQENTHREIRRLVVLIFRLMCYEVRADIQCRENRNTWLDPNGGVCSPAERTAFLRIEDCLANPVKEWAYHHPRRQCFECVGSLLHQCFNAEVATSANADGSFTTPIRPMVVQQWLLSHIHQFAALAQKCRTWRTV
jgi:hypothetical protein